MVTSSSPTSPRGLIVGNYCHDVLLRDGLIVAESLGGASSFISLFLSSLHLQFLSLSKVGPDFKYSPPNPSSPPLISPPPSLTTLFHAHFSSSPRPNRPDRTLRRVHACDPILPSDLPQRKFGFGLAVGVGGEISPDTLERLIEICDENVFVDVQGLIRVFDEVDGSVRLVGLRESGFYHLLPRIRVLKASAEEAEFIDVEEVRQWCCVVVTRGEDGCTVYFKGGGEVEVRPFRAVQVDPTGAGDSFLAGFVVGVAEGLEVADAALLGNLFGSITVGQIGLPKLDSSLLQRVKEEVQRRVSQSTSSNEEMGEFGLMKPPGHEQFHQSLTAAKLEPPLLVQESPRNLQNGCSKALVQGNNCLCNGQQKSMHNVAMHNEPLEPVEETRGGH